jgi:hypothetical protein
MPGRSYGGSRAFYSGQRFSPTGTRQFAAGRVNRSEATTTQFARNRNGITTNHRNGTGQVRTGSNLRSNWQNHVAARHSAGWHRDWDRGRDHSWHGHHCRFINGSWVIFDLGYSPWWPYGYPYDYYGYESYGYDPGYYYEPGVYEGRMDYGDGNYSDQSADSTVSAAQEQLSRAGYYDGEIDGVLGPQTRRAIERYQRRHGQRVTGELTTRTLQTLGLGEVARD